LVPGRKTIKTAIFIKISRQYTALSRSMAEPEQKAPWQQARVPDFLALSVVIPML
jgi:hypothetical protein